MHGGGLVAVPVDQIGHVEDVAFAEQAGEQQGAEIRRGLVGSR